MCPKTQKNLPKHAATMPVTQERAGLCTAGSISLGRVCVIALSFC